MKAWENPLIPMGAITGRPTRGQIERHLAAFRAAGITQYLIYPRSGCELEYLSDEWLDCCECIISEAKKLGFTSLWLYDEFNWPSGQCAGRLQRSNPEFALPVFAVVPAEHGGTGEYVLKIERNPVYPDLLNPAGVEAFLAGTHEVYARRFGAEFGTIIRGVFTDEPSPGYTGATGRDRVNAEGFRIYSWYDGIEEDYLAAYGAPLRRELDSPSFTENHHRLIGKRFRTVYLDRVREWCESHGLLLTGHLNTEHSVRMSKHSNGWPLHVISGFSLPGMDEIHTFADPAEMEFLTFGTVDYAAGKRGSGALAELFALGPSDLPLGRVRQYLYLTALFGVDHFLLAISPLDFRGSVGKPNWLNVYSPDQPFFRHFHLLAAEAAEAAGLTRLARLPEWAVRYPADETEIQDLLAALTQAQLPWHLIDYDDCSDGVETIRRDASGFALEQAGKQFAELTELMAFLAGSAERSFRIVEESGETASGLCCRAYAGGGVAVVNLTERERKLRLEREGESVPFRLAPWDFRSFPAWRVERAGENLFRAPLSSGNCSVTLEKELLLRFALRTYHDPAVLNINSDLCSASEEADFLPQGFRDLYRAFSLRLRPGTYQLELVSGRDGLLYLPALLIAGDFAVRPENVLAEDLHDGRGLENYSGTLRQSARIAIPCDAATVTFECDDLASELIVDGESLGARLYPPYRWRLPEKFAGRHVTMTLVRETSLGPMFGTLPDAPAFHPGRYALRHFRTEARFLP